MFCIYVFSDEDFIPKYIGKAKCFNTRIKQHLNRDRFRYKSWFYNWLNKQISNNKIFYIDILEEVNQENHVEREKFWIKSTKDLGYSLTNMTDGGDGNNNQVFSEETREKHRIAAKNRIWTNESKLKLSQFHKGKTLSNETKEKLRKVNLGKSFPKEVTDKMKKTVNGINILNNSIVKFESLTLAAKFLNCRKSTLSNVITKKASRKYKNYIWNYN